MYTCYGLRLDSDLALPELAVVDGGSPADVLIRSGPVPPPSPTATALPLGLWVDGERIVVEVPEVGRFSCTPAQVTVEPQQTVAEATIRLFLLGTALGAVLVQRGLLVLHGNAFRVADGCAVVVGHSGAGKSTLAAEMHRRGHEVLSDDVVPVDADGLAWPGPPRLKLWQDALDRLGVSSAGLSRVRDSHPKFHLALPDARRDPLPVRWIYILDRHDAPLTLTEVAGASVFTHLHEHSYRKEILVGPYRSSHLAASAALARRVRLVTVARPLGVDSVSASAEAILDDITQARRKEAHATPS